MCVPLAGTLAAQLDPGYVCAALGALYRDYGMTFTDSLIKVG